MSMKQAVRLVMFAWLVTPAFPAHAQDPDKAVCGAAYEQTQTLRRSGKLKLAREQAGVCSRETCAEFVRTDCAQWLAEIDAAMPTVLFQILLDGVETTQATVTLDGQPWLDALDGTAKQIEPGTHSLRVESRDSLALVRDVQIREGEKARKLVFELKRQTSSASSPAPKVPSSSGGFGPGPWIVGGLGLAGLTVGAVTGGLVIQQKSVTKEHCNEEAVTCDVEGLEAADLGRTLGPVSTVALVVGGLAAAASATWMIVASTSDGEAAAATLNIGVSLAPNAAAWRAGVSW